ncbi:MAG TPA: DUF6582 domain-containing protein [Candidatus Eisenbacteria bacterium]|nr:DUF6582 domain-containing protein [Candidatus Eisenbacteria bacterium]
MTTIRRPAEVYEVAELDAAAREKLRDSQFADVDRTGEGHLPIHDDSHIRNAMSRFNQTEFESKSAKDRARRKIVSAAKKRGIEVSPDDAVAKPTRSLRAASTKAGPRGGRRKAH